MIQMQWLQTCKHAVGECLSISKTGSGFWTKSILDAESNVGSLRPKHAALPQRRKKQRKIKEATPDLSKKMDPIAEKAPFPSKMVDNVGRIPEQLKPVAPHDSVKAREVQ